MIKLLTLKTLAFFDFLYQKKLINFLKSNIPNINILIDVGAHKGETLNLFLKNFKINKIYSFEASPSTYKLLKKNTKNFLIDFPNTEIKIENLALGSSEKVINIKHLNESSSSTIKNINSLTTGLLCVGRQIKSELIKMTRFETYQAVRKLNPSVSEAIYITSAGVGGAIEISNKVQAIAGFTLSAFMRLTGFDWQV